MSSVAVAVVVLVGVVDTLAAGGNHNMWHFVLLDRLLPP